MILLDTHTAFWLNTAPQKLSRAAGRAIQRAAETSGLALCSISLWELAMLVDAGRLRINTTVERFLDALVATPGMSLFEITPEVAALSTQFAPDFPNDPADRLIAATARAHGLALVTKDRDMQESPLLRTIW